MALQIDRLALWKEKPRGAEVDPGSAGSAAEAAGPRPRPGPGAGSGGRESSKINERASRPCDQAVAVGGVCRLTNSLLCIPRFKRDGSRPSPLCASGRGTAGFVQALAARVCAFPGERDHPHSPRAPPLGLLVAAVAVALALRAAPREQRRRRARACASTGDPPIYRLSPIVTRWTKCI